MKPKDVIPGVKAIYWKEINEDGSRSGPEKTVILSKPWEVSGGKLVCKILGNYAAGVSIDHLDPITPGSLLAARIQGLHEITDHELEEATRKFFKDRGVNIKFDA